MVNLAGLVTAIGAGALGVQYLRGSWPFTRVKENVYEMTRYFTGHRGPALKGPRTALYVFPIVKKIMDENGKVETVSRRIIDRDSELHFRTNDNFEGDQKIQYNYLIPDEKSAKKFYWDIGKNISLIDEIVHAKISEEIGKRNADDLPKEELEYLEKVQKELGRKDNRNFLYKNYGVIITNIVSKSPDFVPESQRILSLVQEAMRDAEAKKIKANAEAYATQIKASATKQSLEVYVQSARNLLEMSNIHPNHPQYSELLMNQINHFLDIDNYQTMAENGGTIVIGGSSKERIIPIKEKKN